MSAIGTTPSPAWPAERVRAVAGRMEGQPLPQRLADTSRVDRAIDIVLRGLAALPRSTEVLRLVEQAERLRADVSCWKQAPPSAAARERAIRETLVIHLQALRAALSTPAPPRGAARRHP